MDAGRFPARSDESVGETFKILLVTNANCDAPRKIASLYRFVHFTNNHAVEFLKKKSFLFGCGQEIISVIVPRQPFVCIFLLYALQEAREQSSKWMAALHCSSRRANFNITHRERFGSWL